MSQNHGFRQTGRRQQYKQKVLNADEEANPILKAFSGYAKELDAKHDRHERIVKLSRDITIESKRIIFLLHTIDGRKNNQVRIIKEAQERLNSIILNNFKNVALELDGQDPYQFRSAYSPGLQEFIEAYSFMEYLKLSTTAEDEQIHMSNWENLQEKMHYVVCEEKQAKDLAAEELEELADLETKPKKLAAEEKHVKFHVDPTEFILGVADLTGELMRRCINSLGSGETEVCLSTCKVLQQFYTGYIGLCVLRCRELSRKIATMRQSVLKAEQVCYNVKVRGGEAAKWGAIYDTKAVDDVDEGFF